MEKYEEKSGKGGKYDIKKMGNMKGKRKVKG
jgi:hypothetical protein